MTDSRLQGAAFAPDSKTVMISDKNGVLHNWSLATKAEIRTLRASGGRWQASYLMWQFSPDGKTLVATNHHSKRDRSGYLEYNRLDCTDRKRIYLRCVFQGWQVTGTRWASHIKLIDPDSRKQIRDIELPEMRLGEVCTNRRRRRRTRRRKSRASSRLSRFLLMATRLPPGAGGNRSLSKDDSVELESS